MAETRQFAQEFARLRETYGFRLAAELGEVEALAARLRTETPCRDLLLNLYGRLHRLAGSGASFGYPGVSEAAHACKGLILAWLGDGARPAPQEGEELLRHLARLRSAAEKAPVGPPDWPAVQTAPGTVAHPGMPLVWVVDDDPAFSSQLAARLEAFGYAVRHFPDLAAAEQAAMGETPDYLVIDVFFPGPPPRNATEALAAGSPLLKAGCPLAFVSATNDFASRVRAVRLGAEGFFLKPLDVPRLAARISDTLLRRDAAPPGVLIVDDDEDLAAHYRLVLEAAGMRVTVLTDPRRTLDVLAAGDPEILLLDVYMPDCTGPELAGVIRQHERWAGLPIVYLSADLDLDTQIEALSRGGDDFLTKPISDRRLVAAVRSRVERAREIGALINRDALTGLLKHGAIKEAVTAELSRARREGNGLCLAMLDIDHFKGVNDRFGHATGDMVISALATLLRQRLRRTDLAGRYGGEEFLLVLPACRADDARMLLDDIRRRFAAIAFEHGGAGFHCSLSAGIAASSDHPQADAQALLALADGALYRAKGAGRNRVEVAR